LKSQINLSIKTEIASSSVIALAAIACLPLNLHYFSVLKQINQITKTGLAFYKKNDGKIIL
jgi:hypothetical protein